MLSPLRTLFLATTLILCLAGVALADAAPAAAPAPAAPAAAPAPQGPPLSIDLPGDACIHVVVMASFTGFRLDNPRGAVKVGAFGGGLGGGIDFWASKPYTLTLAIAGEVVGGINGAPSTAQIAGVVGLAKWYYAGVTWSTDDSGLYLIAGVDVLRLVTQR